MTALLEVKLAQVEVGVEEVAVEVEGALIGLFGVCGASGVVIGDAEAVPCLGVGGEELGGAFEPADGLLGMAGVERCISPDQGIPAGGLASGEEECRREGGG